MSIDESVPGVISLDVLSAGASKSLSWAGSVNTGGKFLWDIGTTLNWSNSGSAAVYGEGNRVVFSNTASNFVVTVNQQVNPSGVTFGNLSNSYTLAGTGGIASSVVGVVINGGGSVTFANTNTYTAATTVTNGSTLIVNGSLPSSSVIVTGGFIGGNGKLAATPVSLTSNGATALTAGSNLLVNGATSISSGTFTIPAGATLSGTGGINIGSGAQLTVNGITDVGQFVSVNGVTLSGSGAVNGGVTLASGTLSPSGSLALNGAVANSGTSTISGGTISAGGPWTGSGAINIPGGGELLLGGAGSTSSSLTLNVAGILTGTGAVNSSVNVSGSAVVNISAGTVANLNVASSSLINGVTVGFGANAGGTSLSVSGGLVNLDNHNTIPLAALSGGTTNFFGPTVTAATISSTAVVNVSAGSVTSLGVSGGSVTLFNTNIIPTAALSGGTTNLSGPSVTLASISGNAIVNVNNGSVSTLSASGSGTTTVSAPATVGTASVSGGLVNLTAANPSLSAFVVTGGTVILPGTFHINAANLTDAGSATIAPVPLLISSQFLFNGGAAASISGGNSFTYATGGNNLANTTTAANTLTVTGGVLTFTPPLSAGAAGTAVNVDTAQVAYSGTGANPDTGTYWNSPARNATAAAMLNSGGKPTTVTYTQSLANGSFGTGNPNGVLGTFEYNNTPGPMNYTFGGLTPGVAYNLYAIMCSNASGRQVAFTTGGSTQVVTTPANFATVSIASSSVYCEFAGLMADVFGQINVNVAGAGGNNEANVNGFQLVPINSSSGAVSLPNTSIAATSAITLDFGGNGPTNSIGGLSFGGSATLRNVVNGGSVQVGGDFVASANANVSLAAGAGSAPILVLSGTGNVQNIKAANGTTLSLPAVSISAATINVGNTSGYNGSVVLGGATALTAGSAAVTVNAGTLKVAGPLAAAAGASMNVNSGAGLSAGPAGAIGFPVTIQTGATFAPDASAASTALFTGGLTISPSAAFQWSYSGTSSEATLALGSANLNLPGSGNPIFRPQWAVAPALPVYVMTWNAPPANQPAWGFDGSLVKTGNLAVWNDGNGSWNTGSNWVYPSYSGGTLSYQAAGLQLTGLSVTNVAGTAAPVTGTNIEIVPPSASSVVVPGPTSPLSIGTLVIQGSSSATAMLSLQNGGPISPTSVTVNAGGTLEADFAAVNMSTGVLSISGGSAELGNSSNLVGAATLTGGSLSLSGGSIGTATMTSGALSVSGGTVNTLVAGGGAIGITGGTVTNSQISGTATFNATAGTLTVLSISGGSTTVTGPAKVGSATVSGGVATFGNSIGIAGLTVSGGSVAMAVAGGVGAAALSGGTTSWAGGALTTATISGSAVVNVTAGSVPTLNVIASDTSHGVTVGGGASAGTTVFSVSGGLITLNNTNAIPTATLSGGTTNLAGPTVTTLNVSGSATVNIGAANTVSGATLISGGTTRVNDPSGLALQHSAVTVNSNNGLAFSGSSAVLGGLSGTGNFVLPSSVLTVGVNNANTSYGGTLAGSGGLTKAGSGTLLLTSSSTYSGPTLVGAGTLKLTSGISGFGGNGSGWTVTDGANAPTATAIAANVLTLTDNGPPIFETRSAFYNTKVPTGAFTATFVYTAGGNMQADGVTFTLQNSPAGPAALGPNAAGSNLGYFGISPSAAVQLNIYSGDPGGVGSAFTTGGTLSAYTSTGPVNLASGDPIQVMLSYDGSNLVENLLDQTTSQTYSRTYAGVNLPAATGGTSAYVGFTGATGGLFAIQTISNFSFIAGVGNGNLSGLPASTALAISASAVFDLGGANQTVTSLADGTGGGSVIDGASTLPSILTLSPTGGSTTFSGAILGGGTLGAIELVLNGSGAEVLSGTNTYTGGTVVNAGTLVLTNNEAVADGSSLTVGAGAAAFSAPIIGGAPAAVPEPDSLGLLAAVGAALLICTVRVKRAKP